MGLFGKKQTDDCEAMTPDEAEKSGKEKVGTTIGTKPYYNDKE